jgi:hypothetical protein
MQDSGALLLLRPVRSSLSVSMRRHCTQVRRARSPRTVSQLSNSVSALLMPSLTSLSLASSAAISAIVDSSMTVSSPQGETRLGIGRGTLVVPDERRRCPRLWLQDELRDEHDDGYTARVGEHAGCCDVGLSGPANSRNESKCCRRYSCSSCRATYSCQTISRSLLRTVLVKPFGGLGMVAVDVMADRFGESGDRRVTV